MHINWLWLYICYSKYQHQWELLSFHSMQFAEFRTGSTIQILNNISWRWIFLVYWNMWLFANAAETVKFTFEFKLDHMQDMSKKQVTIFKIQWVSNVSSNRHLYTNDKQKNKMACRAVIYSLWSSLFFPTLPKRNSHGPFLQLMFWQES